MKFLENKIPPPLVCLLTGVAMWGLARLTPHLAVPDLWRWSAAAVLALAGVMVAAPAMRAFVRAKTTINPVKIEAASALVTGGVFRLTRNPMYLGLTLLLCGVAVFLAAPWTLLGPLAFVLFITRFQIVPEERVMRAKFGAAFEAYAQKVRRWI